MVCVLLFRGEWYFPAFDSGISRKLCSQRTLLVCLCVYKGSVGGCTFFRRESVGLSSRSRVPAFVFCFLYYFILLHFCLACVSLCFLLFFIFVGVFKSPMWSNLQAAVPPDEHHFGVLADSPPDLPWREEPPVLKPSTPRSTPDGNIGHMIMTCQLSPRPLITSLAICVI